MPPRYPFRSLPALLLVVAALAVPASSAGREIDVDGVQVAERVALSGHDLVLNGAGMRTIWGFHVYVAALYLPDRIDRAADILGQETPRRMRITLLRDTTTDQNLDALKDGMVANNTAEEMAAIRPELDRFFALLKQVHEVPAGTVILFDYLPGQGTRLKIGGRDLGLIPGARFNRAVLRIWLGEDPIQVSLKKALLGLERKPG